MSISLSKSSTELRDAFSRLRTRQDVARLLEVSYATLAWHVYRSPSGSRYTTFTVCKRRGGIRVISAPAGALKILQRKLNQVLQAVYDPKPFVHGFQPGRSIRTNARSHRPARFILNTDLLDFFPSINFGRVRGMFMAFPYYRNAEVATILAQICCFDNQLPQGAPTSPVVSNMICAKLDSELKMLAAKYKCFYTRFADDLTFSTRAEQFPDVLATCLAGQTNLSQELIDIIRRNGFEVNSSKSRLRGRPDRLEVTGLVVNAKVNVRRSFVREVRAMLHAWEKFGYQAAEMAYLARRPSGSSAAPTYPLFREVVLGKISFIGQIRGNKDQLYRKFLLKFRKLHSSTTY